jgi:uncharacterized protein (DUF362 family)
MDQNQIWIAYGNEPGAITDQLLRRIDLARWIRPGATIGLKPNLVVASRAASGATTHPEIAEAIILYLREHGFNELAILEGSWLGEDTERAFRNCGFEELARRHRVRLVDLKRDAAVKKRVGDLELSICRTALETDFLINLPVLKAHCQTALTCALKNLKGCIPDSEKRRYHALGLHRPIAALAAALRPSLTIVDALCGDLTFEEGGNPVRMDRIIAGTDPVLLDTYAANLIGLHPDEVPYIGLASGLGAGSMDLTRAAFNEINPDQKPLLSGTPSGKARSLGRNVEERQACSTCYGSLIHALYRLSEEHSLSQLPPLRIGQGFKGVTGSGLGIGSCTRNLEANLPGCPPTARDITAFLKEHLK